MNDTTTLNCSVYYCTICLFCLSLGIKENLVYFYFAMCQKNTLVFLLCFFQVSDLTYWFRKTHRKLYFFLTLQYNSHQVHARILAGQIVELDFAYNIRITYDDPELHKATRGHIFVKEISLVRYTKTKASELGLSTISHERQIEHSNRLKFANEIESERTSERTWKFRQFIWRDDHSNQKGQLWENV